MKTVMIAMALLVLANGAALSSIRQDLPEPLKAAATAWRSGTMLIAGGALSLAIAANDAAQLLLPLANAAIVFGFGFYHRALERFYGAPVTHVEVIPGAIATGAMFWFLAVDPNFIVRVAFASLATLFVLFRTVVFLRRQRPRDDSRCRNILYLTYLVVLIFIALRLVVLIFLGPEPGATIITNAHAINRAAPMFVALLPVVGTTTFALLCADHVNRRIALTAATDYLTGLPNRRSLMENGEARFQAAKALGAPFALAVLDIDRFKAVNDAHGHDIGDRVLMAVADSLMQAVRPGDLVARSGGEEFVVVLDRLDQPAGLAIMEAVRAAVKNRRIEIEDMALRVTVSVGLAFRQPGDTVFDDILRRADKALYAAKDDGRNLVALAD